MKILISQNAPSNPAPYTALTEKFGVEFTYKPFFTIRPLAMNEFRTQRINVADYTAVVFSSRYAIDAYFSICEGSRFKVPETMKYFCTTDLVATYLQKYIVYRKRKIFFGDGKPESVINLIGPRHKDENFLVTASDTANAAPLTSLMDKAGIKYAVAVMVTDEPQDIKDINLEDFDLIALYNPFDIKSLYSNFPDFKQGNIKFLSYGKGIAKALEEAGLSIAVQGPTPEAPSVARAIELYLDGK